MEPVSETPVEVNPSTSEASRRRQPAWYRALQALGYGAALIVGARLAGGPKEVDESLPMNLATGAVAGILALVVVGTVGYWIARYRRTGRSWRRVVVGKVAIITTLVLLALSFSGRVATQEEAVERAAPNPSGTSSERIRANREAAQWGRTRGPVLLSYSAAVQRNGAFIRRLTNEGNSAGVRALASRIQGGIDAARAQLAVLPQTPLADLERVDRDLLRAMRLASSAFSDYNAGLRANAASGLALADDESSLALLDAGDAKLNRAARIFLTIQTKRLPALDAKYGIR